MGRGELLAKCGKRDELLPLGEGTEGGRGKAGRVDGARQSDVAEPTAGPLQISGNIELSLCKSQICFPHTTAKIALYGFLLVTHNKP